MNNVCKDVNYKVVCMLKEQRFNKFGWASIITRNAVWELIKKSSVCPIEGTKIRGKLCIQDSKKKKKKEAECLRN